MLIFNYLASDRFCLQTLPEKHLLFCGKQHFPARRQSDFKQEFLLPDFHITALIIRKRVRKKGYLRNPNLVNVNLKSNTMKNACKDRPFLSQ